MKRLAGVLFFISWLLCGCNVETMLDDWRSCVVAVIALIVAICCAAVLGHKED